MFRNIEDHISYVVINHSLSAWISSMFRLTIRAVRTYGHLYTAWVAIRSTKFTNDSFVPLYITILRKRRSYHRLDSAIRIVELHHIIDIVYHTRPACIVIYVKRKR